MEQDTVPIDNVWRPEDHGLWRKYKLGEGPQSYYLDELALNRARATGDPIGTCRNCGGDLVVIQSWPAETSGTSVRWIEWECVSCGKQYAAPDGKYLQRSSAHSRQTAGWMGRRFTALKKGNAGEAP